MDNAFQMGWRSDIYNKVLSEYKKELHQKTDTTLNLLAEREGFEPPVPLGTAVFKTAVIDHSTTFPTPLEEGFLSKAVQRYGIFLNLANSWPIFFVLRAKNFKIALFMGVFER